ncbi:MAG: hypothetical protein QNJ84_11305 [Alphaproteobacteria bacterium]|nr:hypothetical protein [Alphaproteobacteria bacterium]
MRWALGLIGAVAALAVAALFVAPAVIDWDDQKERLTAVFEDATGLTLEIDGGLDVDLFPRPRLTMSRLTVQASPRDVGPATNTGGLFGLESATIRWARVVFTLSDLMRGDLNVTRIELVEPAFAFRSLSVEPTPSPARSEAASNAEPPDGAIGERPGWLDPAVILSIQDGALIHRPDDQAEGAILAAAMSGTVAAPGVGRRYSVDLQAIVDGAPLALELRVAPPSASRSEAGAALAATLTAADTGAVASATGLWRPVDGGHLAFDGRVTADAPRLAPLLARHAAEIDRFAPFDGGVRVEGALQFDSLRRLASAPEFRIDGNGLSAVMSLEMDWRSRPKLDLKGRISRLDLDALARDEDPVRTDLDQGVLEAARQASGASSDGPVQDNVARRLESLQGGDSLLALLGRSGFDASIDIVAAGARFRDTLLRRLALRATLESGALTVEELSASLPGGADIALAGFGDLTGDAKLLEGNASLRADDLTRLLAWLGAPPLPVAADRLRRLSLVSGVTLRPGRFDIRDAAIEIDDVTARASAALAFAGRLGLSVRARMDRLNLDAYRPAPGGGVFTTGNNAAPRTGTSSTDSSRSGSEAQGAGLWRDVDGYLDLGVDQLTIFGASAAGVQAVVRFQSGLGTLESLEIADLAGGAYRATGQWPLASGAQGGRAPPDGVFNLSGAASSYGRLAATLGAPDFLSRQLRLMGPGTVAGEWRLSRRGEDRLTLQLEAERGAVGATLTSMPDRAGALLLEAAAFETEEIALSDGSATVVADLTGGLVIEDARAALNGGVLALDGALRRNDGFYRAEASFDLKGLSLERTAGDLNGALGVAGSLDAKGALTARAADVRGLASSLEGRVALTGTARAVLGPPASTIVRVRSVEAVRAALSAGFADPGASYGGSMTLTPGAVEIGPITATGTDGATLVVAGAWRPASSEIQAEVRYAGAPDAPASGAASSDRLASALLRLSGPSNRPSLSLVSVRYASDARE